MGASVTSVNTFQLLTSNHIHNNGFHFANNGCWLFELNQLWFPYLDYQTCKTFRSQSFLLWSVKISSEVEGTRTGQKVPFMEHWLLKAQYKTIKSTDLETGQRGEMLEDKGVFTQRAYETRHRWRKSSTDEHTEGKKQEVNKTDN